MLSDDCLGKQLNHLVNDPLTNQRYHNGRNYISNPTNNHHQFEHETRKLDDPIDPRVQVN